eukprot:TRINITY_DN3218_c0_g1_i6.p2 TRINITY_DN3218_c0_g1~~TRINITY_DN3218_c0_g1_i6.p2  ORF type:complete len:176 (+),score=24.81 TRINITY_DN3218_c0_g1_i6:781-1308(+)
MLCFSQDYHRIKTKIRRLYDIANVLQALHLIEKTLLPTRKPGFKWLGYKSFHDFFETARQQSRRDFSFAGEATQKVFIVSHEPLPRTLPQKAGPRFFKPRVLQLNSLPLGNSGKRAMPEIDNKENIEILSGCHGAFTRLGDVAKIRSANRVEEKVQSKSFKKRVLMESQIINLAL